MPDHPDPPTAPIWRPHRALLFSRLLLIGYALALTVGTHWPRLQLGTEEVPAPDKMLHWLAFGGLALLLWASGWLSGLVGFTVVALAWPAIDEISQALPGLGRTISWLDLLASQLGALAVIAWRVAMAPVGKEANRARLAFDHLSWQCALSTVPGGVLAGAAGGVGAVAIGAATWLITRGGDVSIVMAAAAMGGLLAALGAGEGVRRRAWNELAAHRACFRCAASCAGIPCDDRGRLSCPACHQRQWVGQWQGLAVDRARLVSLLVGPVLLSVGLFAAVLGLYALTGALHGRWPVLGRLSRMYHGLPFDLRVVIDLTLMLIVAAAGAARFRSSVARHIDRARRVCVACGHDLRGTVFEDGLGRCSECGRAVVAAPGPSAPEPEPAS